MLDCKICHYWMKEHNACGLHTTVPGGCKDFVDVLRMRTYMKTQRVSDERKMNIILDNGAFKPEFAHKTDAGADLRSPVEAVVPAHGSVVIDTGVHVEIPEGYVGMLKSKSGLNAKHNLIGEGVIDCGFMGSIRVKLYNHGDTDYQILRGDKIIQMVILPCVYCEFTGVEEFADSERGTGGFGSTGR